MTLVLRFLGLGVLGALLVLGFSVVDSSLGFVSYEIDERVTWPIPTSRDDLLIGLGSLLSSEELTQAGGFGTLQTLSTSDLRTLYGTFGRAPRIRRAWTGSESFFSSTAIREWHQEYNPQGLLEFKVWLAQILTPQNRGFFVLSEGIWPAIWGSLFILLLATSLSFLLGFGTGLYLGELGQGNRWSKFVERNVFFLAGVPPVVFGIFGFALFQGNMSLLAGGVAVALYLLPGAIVATYDGIRSVPIEIRLTGRSLGLGWWRVTQDWVIPQAWPHILSDYLGYLVRALGDAAALLMVSGMVLVNQSPRGLNDPFTTIPIQIFHWAVHPEPGFRNLAASGILVLFIVMGGLYSISGFGTRKRKKYNEF